MYYAVPGQRNKWVRVGLFQVESGDKDLGTIEHYTGRIVVKCTPSEATDKLRLSLQIYNPDWTHGLNTGVLEPRNSDGDPFVFNFVPSGDYELVASRPGHPIVLQRVEVTPSKLKPEITLNLPNGTTSLQGKIDKAIFGPRGYGSLKLWNQNKRLLTRFAPDDEGNYAVKNLPAGDYYLTTYDTRDAQYLIQKERSKNIESLTQQHENPGQ